MIRGIRYTVIITLALTIAVSAVYAQQGIYVPPPSPGLCATWWSDLPGGYYVVYNYGNQSYSIYVFTGNAFNSWWYDKYTTPAVINFALSPGSMHAFALSNGSYYVVVYPVPCNESAPINLYGPGQGYPTGIVSLGPVSTSEVMGFFNITSISAYNPVGESQFSVPNSGVTLQLNVYLVVGLSNGVVQYYWLQNTVGFVTDKSEFGVWDNIWNDSGTYSILSNSTVTGINGAVIVSEGDYLYTSYYAYTTYALPISGYLITRLVSTNPLVVQFCYVIIRQGSSYFPPSPECYDEVTIHTYTPANNAYLEAIPNTITNADTPLDAELVFGGYGNGEYTTFNALNAYLALLYWNGSSWVPFPNLYSVGVSTLESATDLTSTVLPNGLVSVNVGTPPNGGFLTQHVAKPVLYTTYVQFFNPITYETISEYVTKPTTYTAPTTVIINNTTEYVLTGFTVNGQSVNESMVIIYPGNDFITYNIEPVYNTYYLVSVRSPIPITISTYNETETTREFTEWLPQGSSLGIYVPSTYYFNNNTRIVYTGSNETIIINTPLTLTITDLTKQYLVKITSKYPININGTLTTNYEAWLSPGTKLTIEPETLLINGIIMTEPGHELTIEKPMNITAQWNANWPLTVTMYSGITTAVAIGLVFILRKSRKYLRL